MTTHNNVFNFQKLDSELRGRLTIQIAMKHLVGNVAVYKNFAGLQIDNGVGRYTAIGTTNPEVLRRLLILQAFEKLRVFVHLSSGPSLVGIKKV